MEPKERIKFMEDRLELLEAEPKQEDSFTLVEMYRYGLDNYRMAVVDMEDTYLLEEDLDESKD